MMNIVAGNMRFQQLGKLVRESADNKDFILSEPFYVITPDTANPYKQLYTPN